MVATHYEKINTHLFFSSITLGFVSFKPKKKNKNFGCSRHVSILFLLTTRISVDLFFAS